MSDPGRQQPAGCRLPRAPAASQCCAACLAWDADGDTLCGLRAATARRREERELAHHATVLSCPVPCCPVLSCPVRQQAQRHGRNKGEVACRPLAEDASPPPLTTQRPPMHAASSQGRRLATAAKLARPPCRSAPGSHGAHHRLHQQDCAPRTMGRPQGLTSTARREPFSLDCTLLHR
jgi:hypothetical protein